MPPASFIYFNPGNEEAIGISRRNYTPAFSVRRMAMELACLPLWYGDSEDVVWAESPADEAYAERMRQLFPRLPRLASPRRLFSEPHFVASPWGLAPNVLAQFERMAKQYRLPLEVPVWTEAYRRLASRETARQALASLHALLPPEELPSLPFFATSLDALNHWLDGKQGTFLLKAPFSSSGRGLLSFPATGLDEKKQQWATAVIRKQGAVSIEPLYDKVKDFAMEFYSDGKGQVAYRGLSLFQTVRTGAYSGNLLGTEAYRLQQLEAYISLPAFERTKEAVCQVLASLYGTAYQGPLGVDMFLYRPAAAAPLRIHPCVEINMRQTMGGLALHLSEHYLAPAAQGVFSLSFHKEPGEALARHREMCQRHPLQLQGQRIAQGYLNLCPVHAETGYWAYILVEMQNTQEAKREEWIRKWKEYLQHRKGLIESIQQEMKDEIKKRTGEDVQSFEVW